MECQRECTVSQTWAKKMPKGLHLEIAHHTRSMRCVANLVIALERLKGGMSEEVLGTHSPDENLLRMVLESVVEEKLIFERSSAPSNDFIRMDEHVFNVTDSKKRDLVLDRNSMELIAVMLQGGSNKRKVFLNMASYAHPRLSTEGLPVVLAIRDTNLYLSCHLEGNTPALHLEPVEDKETLKNISSDSEMRRFLFYKQDTGITISSLMSARYPNWFISTADKPNQPVKICQESANLCRSFHIQHQN